MKKLIICMYAMMSLNQIIAQAPAPPDIRGGKMCAGSVLYNGQKLISANGKFTLSFTVTGNIVITNISVAPNEIVWESATNTASSFTKFLQMQADGNFVLYDINPSSQRPFPIWNSVTNGCPNSCFILDDVGNSYILCNGRIIYQTYATVNTSLLKYTNAIARVTYITGNDNKDAGSRFEAFITMGNSNNIVLEKKATNNVDQLEFKNNSTNVTVLNKANNVSTTAVLSDDFKTNGGGTFKIKFRPANILFGSDDWEIKTIKIEFEFSAPNTSASLYQFTKTVTFSNPKGIPIAKLGRGKNGLECKFDANFNPILTTVTAQ